MTALDELWSASTASGRRFEPNELPSLDAPVKRYLTHAIAPATPLATACRIRMRGEMRLGSWRPFSAEEVISWSKGMIWSASVRLFGLPIRGSDSFVNGQGRMQWSLVGAIPFIRAGGHDVSRSIAGRLNIESVWLPAVFCLDAVQWTVTAENRFRADFQAHGEAASIDMAIDDRGGLRRFEMPRWGNPDGRGFRIAPFGGFAEEEGRFSGYTIPTRIRIGWFPDHEGFAQNGEFFRATVERVDYRTLGE